MTLRAGPPMRRGTGGFWGFSSTCKKTSRIEREVFFVHPDPRSWLAHLALQELGQSALAYGRESELFEC
jgi:hypothetical protein